MFFKKVYCEWEMIEMIFYRVPTSVVPNIHFLSREHLTVEHTHITRTVKETIIYLITGGRLDLETDYGEVNLVPGDIHVFRKGEFQKPLSFGECEYYYFHLHDDFEETELSEEELKKYYYSSQNYFLSSNQYEAEAICSEYKKMLIPKHFNIISSPYESKIRSCLKAAVIDRYTEKAEYYKFCAGLKAAEFFVMLHRACSEAAVSRFFSLNSEVIKSIIEYLETHTYEHITGGLLEKKFGYSFDYMNRRFKESIGQTVFSYLSNVRINQAKNLLITQKMPIKQIAEEVGFCDIYYFSKVFHRKTGMSPTEFSKREHI